MTKNNHESVIRHIRNAIQECKEDSVLQATKSYLFAALRMVEGVEEKRASRESQSKIFAEQAKKRNEQWMKMLADGLKLGRVQENEN